MDLFQHNPYELSNLILSALLGLVVAIVILPIIMLRRLIKKRPLIEKPEKLKSPKILYLGIAFFGSAGLISFITRRPYFGMVFIIFTFAYIIGLIAYNRGWRG